MAVINIERVECIMHLSNSVSIKEILDLDRLHDPVYGGMPYGLYISAYINSAYYRIVYAEYYENLEEAHEAMNGIIESWEKNPHRIIKTKE